MEMWLKANSDAPIPLKAIKEVIKEITDYCAYHLKIANCAYHLKIANIILDWNRDIEGYDKAIFVGCVKEKPVNITKNKVICKRPHLTIQQIGYKLIMNYVAKDREEENDIGKILQNAIKHTRKWDLSLVNFYLTFLELEYNITNYSDLYYAVNRLNEQDFPPFLFQYNDKKNRYWKKGNFETFLKQQLYRGIKNYYTRIDKFKIVHGYFKNNGKPRLELWLPSIQILIFKQNKLHTTSKIEGDIEN